LPEHPSLSLHTQGAPAVPQLFSPAVLTPSLQEELGGGRGGGRGCAFTEKLATLLSGRWCLKSGGTTWEMVNSLPSEVSKLRPDEHLKRKSAGGSGFGLGCLGRSLFNPEFLKICVCPVMCTGCVCVCVCVCVRAHWHAPPTLHPYTHSPGWLWHIWAHINMPTPSSGHSAQASIPQTCRLPPRVCAQEARRYTSPARDADPLHPPELSEVQLTFPGTRRAGTLPCSECR